MAQCQCPAAPTITGEQQHHLHAGQHPIQLATASHSDVFRFGLKLQVKLVLQRNKLFVESPDKQVLQRLLKDSDISAAHAACGGGGITSGRGRRDTAAQAMASHLQNIDLTENVPDEDLNDAEGDGDVEAAEAERDLLAASAGAAAAKGSSASAPPGRGAAAAGAAGRPVAGQAGQAPAQCESRAIPFAEKSAIGAVSEHDVDIFSFEISALHVCFPSPYLQPAPRRLSGVTP